MMFRATDKVSQGKQTQCLVPARKKSQGYRHAAYLHPCHPCLSRSSHIVVNHFLCGGHVGVPKIHLQLDVVPDPEGADRVTGEMRQVCKQDECHISECQQRALQSLRGHFCLRNWECSMGEPILNINKCVRTRCKGYSLVYPMPFH